MTVAFNISDDNCVLSDRLPDGTLYVMEFPRSYWVEHSRGWASRAIHPFDIPNRISVFITLFAIATKRRKKK